MFFNKKETTMEKYKRLCDLIKSFVNEYGVKIEDENSELKVHTDVVFYRTNTISLEEWKEKIL